MLMKSDKQKNKIISFGVWIINVVNNYHYKHINIQTKISTKRHVAA